MHNYENGGPSKRGRQGKLLHLIEERPVSSQAMLAELLRQQGVQVTQSTLSRDIRELGLVKVRGSYQVAHAVSGEIAQENVRRTFRQLMLQSEVSGNILMLKTAPGNAHSLGVVLDAARWPEILGTVAGDDTIFALLRNTRAGRRVLRRIQELSA